MSEEKHCYACKKIIVGEARHYYPGLESPLFLCKECLEKQRDKDDERIWRDVLSLIGTDELHCLKCTQKLSKENISNTYTDIDRTSFKCPQCQLDFTIYHGEYSCDEWFEEDPRSDQEIIDEYHRQKYGEY